MKTVGYRITAPNGQALSDIFFPEQFKGADDAPLPNQQEAVLRSDAEELINAAVQNLAAGNEDMTELKREHKTAIDYLNNKIEETARERDGWIESAKHFSRGQEYYQGLVRRCGHALGYEAYICDDGSISDDVLAEKVPELVEQLVQHTVRQSRRVNLNATLCALMTAVSVALLFLAFGK